MTPDPPTQDVFAELADVYAPVALVVFLLVCAALLVISVRFRARPGHESSPRAASPRLEAGYAVGLAVIAGLLVWRTYDAMSTIDPVNEQTRAGATGRPALTVGILASRWNWRFTYPGGVAQVGDGRERVATLVVPAGVAVRFHLSAKDVAHAFWIPALRFKYDAVPGRVNRFDLRFTRGLDYSTARCSEFCGLYHDQMRLRVQVLAPEAFGRWLRDRQTAI